MKITKELSRLFKAKEHNNHMMLRMIELAIKLIDKQGHGAYVKDYGVVYFNPETGDRDAIALLTGIPDRYLLKHYGVISEQYQRPIVSHLIKRYMIDVYTTSERTRFVEILQKLQDIHDESFDPDAKIYTNAFRMSYFMSKCELMKESLK